MKNEICVKCHGKGGLTMNGVIVARCPACCKHEKGWQLLNDSFGSNSGKLLCKEWCGYMKNGRIQLKKN